MLVNGVAQLSSQFISGDARWVQWVSTFPVAPAVHGIIGRTGLHRVNIFASCTLVFSLDSMCFPRHSACAGSWGDLCLQLTSSSSKWHAVLAAAVSFDCMAASGQKPGVLQGHAMSLPHVHSHMSTWPIVPEARPIVFGWGLAIYLTPNAVWV